VWSRNGALIAELRRLGLEVVDKRAELARIAAAGRRALGRAVVVDDPEAVASAAVATGGMIPAQIRSRSVAEVRVIELDAGRASRPRTGGTQVGGFGPPSSARHHAGLRQLQAIEEAGDLLAAARRHRRLDDLVSLPHDLLGGRAPDLAGAVADHRELPGGTAPISWCTMRYASPVSLM
jgi:hypothetical protein